MNVTVCGLPADHPDAAPIQALVERLVDLTHDQRASVVLSSLFSLYRHGLMQHPDLHEVAIKHLLQVSDELMALKSGQAAPRPTPAVPAARGSAVELNAEAAEIASKLTRFIAGQAWPHDLLLAVLLMVFHETALANRCCLAMSVGCLAEVLESLRQGLAADPAAAGQHASAPLH